MVQYLWLSYEQPSNQSDDTVASGGNRYRAQKMGTAGIAHDETRRPDRDTHD